MKGKFTLNFQGRFADLVQAGKKRQTIRAERKDGQRPRVGQWLSLWTGLRTKNTRQLGLAKCSRVRSIRIGTDLGIPFVIIIDEDDSRSLLLVHHMKELARKDGFASLEEFHKFFARNPKTKNGVFEGFLVEWGKIK